MIGMPNQFPRFFYFACIFSLLSGCLPDSPDRVEPEAFFQELSKVGVWPKPLSLEKSPILRDSVAGYTPLAIYTYQDIEWALFDLPRGYTFDSKIQHLSNHNLHIVSQKPLPEILSNTFNALAPQIGYEQLGIFVYPLAICLVLSVFITIERLISLRRGLTFPRKVEKALLNGEFPNKKWKKGSAAERIVHVAIHENASAETLQTYAKLEVTAMERGMYLLEVVVAAAPLIGLLGTVTGLVEVFSQMPTGGGVDKSLFSEGISLALLTTMAGLGIAIPTLLFNSYLQRVLDKRASALEWLTARLIEAKDRSRHSTEILR